MVSRDSAEDENPPRAAIACASCAKTKAKCDRRHPCGRCQAKGLTCISRSSRRGKAGKASGIVTVTAGADRSGSASLASDAVANGSFRNYYPSSPATEPRHRQPGTTASVAPARQPSGPPREAATELSDPPAWPAVTGLHAPTTEDPSNRSTANNGLPDGSSMDTGSWDGINSGLEWLPRGFTPLLDAALQEIPDTAPWLDFDVHSARDTPLPAPVPSQDASLLDHCEFEISPMPNLEHWGICQCNPLPQLPARDTGKSSIAAIDQNFIRPGAWSSIVADWRAKHFEPAERLVNLPLSDSTREWLMMVAQRLLRVAMDVHALNPNDFGPLGGYIRLPPSYALHSYLEIVLRNFEPFYPLLPARTINPSILTSNKQGRGSSLLLFLMLAFGSMIDPAPKARQFSAALTEICRHSITDLLEKELDATESCLAIYCGLLFIVKGAFSGDKAHMNISIAHRYVYLMFMRSAGIFNLQRAPDQSLMPSTDGDIRLRWESWREQQCSSRLAYGWVMLEHEISLFYGGQPALNISELQTVLPAGESLWLASTAAEWHRAMSQNESTGDTDSGFNPQSELSLCALFQSFKDNLPDRSGYQPQLLHMRLLLYPIHILVTELSQLLSCVPTSGRSRPFSGPVTQASSMLRFDEIQILLQRWYDTFAQVVGCGARFRAMHNATMLLFHLTSLNLFTAFDEIELLARKGYSETDAAPVETWLRSPEHVLVHCGQVLRLLDEIEDELRPVWSACAVYRVTMILWAFGIWDSRISSRDNVISMPPLAINAFQMNDRSVQQYLRSCHADPHIITKDANRVSVYDPEAILSLGIQTLYYGPLTTPFSLGVRSKLEAMSEAWKGYHRDLKRGRSS
ncbi:hypothetical protein F4818DRAFT_363538 [Hypoxylon cercidicola]|nr:hypothetical protein F4818DRAFT_363538 [Hypoxylon cercidicola]